MSKVSWLVCAWLAVVTTFVQNARKKILPNVDNLEIEVCKNSFHRIKIDWKWCKILQSQLWVMGKCAELGPKWLLSHFMSKPFHISGRWANKSKLWCWHVTQTFASSSYTTAGFTSSGLTPFFTTKRPPTLPPSMVLDFRYYYTIQQQRVIMAFSFFRQMSNFLLQKSFFYQGQINGYSCFSNIGILLTNVVCCTLVQTRLLRYVIWWAGPTIEDKVYWFSLYSWLNFYSENLLKC